MWFFVFDDRKFLHLFYFDENSERLSQYREASEAVDDGFDFSDEPDLGVDDGEDDVGDRRLSSSSRSSTAAVNANAPNALQLARRFTVQREVILIFF